MKPPSIPCATSLFTLALLLANAEAVIQRVLALKERMSEPILPRKRKCHGIVACRVAQGLGRIVCRVPDRLRYRSFGGHGGR